MTPKQAHYAICPFVEQPFAGCRVHQITGQTIPQIMEFCGSAFTECPLYRQYMLNACAAKRTSNLPDSDNPGTIAPALEPI